MSKYEIILETSDNEYTVIVDTPPMTLESMTALTLTSLVESAIEQLNSQGVDITQLDVISTVARELDDYEEYLLEEGKPNE